MIRTLIIRVVTDDRKFDTRLRRRLAIEKDASQKIRKTLRYRKISLEINTFLLNCYVIYKLEFSFSTLHILFTDEEENFCKINVDLPTNSGNSVNSHREF